SVPLDCFAALAMTALSKMPGGRHGSGHGLCQKRLQRRERRLRVLLRQEMAAVDRLPLGLRREGLAPDVERACALGRDAGFAPQHECRAEDALVRSEIGL